MTAPDELNAALLADDCVRLPDPARPRVSVRPAEPARPVSFATWGDLTAVTEARGLPADYFGTPGTDDVTAGDMTSPLLKKMVCEAAIRLMLATNGILQGCDLLLECSRPTAHRLRSLAEIRGYLQGGSWSVAFAQSGLPQTLYGLFVKDDADLAEGHVRVRAGGTVPAMRFAGLSWEVRDVFDPRVSAADEPVVIGGAA